MNVKYLYEYLEHNSTIIMSINSNNNLCCPQKSHEAESILLRTTYNLIILDRAGIQHSCS